MINFSNQMLTNSQYTAKSSRTCRWSSNSSFCALSLQLKSTSSVGEWRWCPL